METKEQILNMSKSELRSEILTWHFSHVGNMNKKIYPESRGNVNCLKSIYCIECIDCMYSTNCLESKKLDGCIDCCWCENCISCVDCEFLVNGIYCIELKLGERNPDKYYIRNVEVTEVEFKLKKVELFC